jgi:hypothetical protein
VLRMGNIQGGQLDWTDLLYTSDPVEIRKYRLQPGDVLFNRTNSPELVGKTALFKTDRPAIFAGYLIRVRCSDRLVPAYLVYCLNSPAGRDYCWRVKTDGVSQSNITLFEEDVAHELMSCYAPHAVPIVKTLRYQGCRIGEALRLRLPSDVSLRRETMTFRDTKNHEPRTVPMHDVTARMLREYLGKRDIGPVFLTPQGTAYNDRRLAARGVGYDGSGIRTAHRSALLRYSIRRVLLRTGAVCTHCSGIVVEAPGRSNSARLQLIRPRTKGGAEELQNYRIVCATCAREYPADEPVLTWFRIHDWRHHWASWFMMKGGTETELMALGGWKDPRMVRRYVRLSVEHLRKAVNQV